MTVYAVAPLDVEEGAAELEAGPAGLLVVVELPVLVEVPFPGVVVEFPVGTVAFATVAAVAVNLDVSIVISRGMFGREEGTGTWKGEISCQRRSENGRNNAHLDIVKGPCHWED